MIAKGLVWIGGLSPAAWLAYRAWTGDLGANPIEEIQLATGWWGLTFLLCALAVTPIRRFTRWKRVIRLRRLVGLFAFFYVTLHFLNYLVLDQFFAWEYIAEDILERPFITIGFAAWLILLSLASTSTTGWIRRLGGRWRKLHSLIYIAAVLGALHFTWKVKADTREPLVFAGVLAILLATRIPDLLRRRRSRMTA